MTQMVIQCTEGSALTQAMWSKAICIAAQLVAHQVARQFQAVVGAKILRRAEAKVRKASHLNVANMQQAAALN